MPFRRRAARRFGATFAAARAWLAVRWIARAPSGPPPCSPRRRTASRTPRAPPGGGPSSSPSSRRRCTSRGRDRVAAPEEGLLHESALAVVLGAAVRFDVHLHEPDGRTGRYFRVARRAP